MRERPPLRTPPPDGVIRSVYVYSPESLGWRKLLTDGSPAAVNELGQPINPAEYERQVNAAVQSDPEVQAFVERLEQVVSTEVTDDPGPLPSGETIARDLQRFLRQRGEDPAGPGV